VPLYIEIAKHQPVFTCDETEWSEPLPRSPQNIFECLISFLVSLAIGYSGQNIRKKVNISTTWRLVY